MRPSCFSSVSPSLRPLAMSPEMYPVLARWRRMAESDPSTRSYCVKRTRKGVSLMKSDFRASAEIRRREASIGIPLTVRDTISY